VASNIETRAAYEIGTPYLRAGYSIETKIGEFGPYFFWDGYSEPDASVDRMPVSNRMPVSTSAGRGRLSATMTLEEAKAVWPRLFYRMKKDTVRPQDRADAARIREAFDLEDE